MTPWLTRFKLALIQEDENRLLSLIENIPLFESENDMHQALVLIENASDLFEEKKSELNVEMQKVLKTKKYISSSL